MKLRNKNTGEIFDGCIIVCRKEDGENFAIKDNPECSTIAELNERFEDYISPGPLIKDEKIRKAVSIWAEVNSIKEVLYCERMNRSLCNITDMGDYDFGIEFVGWIPTLKDSETYTIAELCGEEE